MIVTLQSVLYKSLFRVVRHRVSRKVIPHVCERIGDPLKKRYVQFIVFIAVVVVIVLLSGFSFTSMWKDPPIVPGPGVTEIKMLSDWLPSLAGTKSDTEVYIIRGSQPGGNLLLLGGNHPNEPGGMLAAVLMIENVSSLAGTVYIIPRANHSAFTHNDPMEGAPQFFSIELPDGSKRTFRFGSRRTNPVSQWPDPTIYNHPTGSTLGGSEISNLNRAFPGREDGLITERVAAAIMNIVKQEKIDLVCDLHESSPEYPVNNAIVFHQKAAELAIMTQMMLEMEGVNIRLEESPPSLRGLTHREIGDNSDAYVVLLEVANPSQGRLRGKTTEELVTTGVDKYYLQASKDGKLFAPYDETGYPLELRVARHVTTVRVLLDSWNMMFPDRMIMLSDVPAYNAILSDGLGAFLKPVS
jgi:hypothetical protein